MVKIKFSTAVRNLQKNFLLLFSTGAALCLFLSPSIFSLAIIGGIFIAVCVAASYDLAKPHKSPLRYSKLFSGLIAVLIGSTGYDAFRAAWAPYRRVAALASAFGITTPTLLTIIGLIGCIAGAYALYVLGQWITKILCFLLHKIVPEHRRNEILTALKNALPEYRKNALITNLKRNWFLPISAMAFFFLNNPLTQGYAIAMYITFVILLVLASQIPSVPELGKAGSLPIKITAMLTACGICWASQATFVANQSKLPEVQALEALLPWSMDIPAAAGALCAVAAFGFVYLCVLHLFLKIKSILIDTKIASDLRSCEIILYALLIAGSLAIMIAAFSASQAFYGTKLLYDIIYTSDSPSLVKGNVYMALAYAENDIRQPLFAVFAAPFMGIPYLIGRLFCVSAPVQAMLLNAVQIVMLFAANFMLAKMMRFTGAKRICFMILTSLTYAQLLFMLMMEQYIVAYFWLIFCGYLICEKKQPSRIALWGAGGTLLTSMILLPAMSEKSPFRNFKEWFLDMIKYGLEFVAFLLLFCRFDVIFNLAARIAFFSRFTGKDITFSSKICQYTSFIADCFIAPDAGINYTAEEYISWQLNPSTEISFVGVLILGLCLISAWVNRSKKSSLLAAGWIGFSVIMLLGLGWGTQENGLILYALYFGWAFLVLLFQLVEKIGDKLKLHFLVPVTAVIGSVLLAAVNLPAIVEMIQFAIQYYPV